MQIHKLKNISFGTNIKFISPIDFKKVERCFSSSEGLKNLIRIYDTFENQEESKLCYRLNKKHCWTKGIKTCVGIAVADKENKKTSFFAHFFHSEDTYQKLPLIKDYLKGNNAIIIGQRKDRYEASSKIFEQLQTYCKTNNIPTTILRGLKLCYESNIAYDGDTDTLFVCVSNIDNNKKYVDSIKKLRHVFSNVSIAACDKIEFLKHCTKKQRSFLVRIFKKLFKAC